MIIIFIPQMWPWPLDSLLSLVLPVRMASRLLALALSLACPSIFEMLWYVEYLGITASWLIKKSFGIVRAVPKHFNINVFPLPLDSINLPESYLLGFLLGHRASSWLSSPKALLLCIRNHLVAFIVYLGPLTWLPIIRWPDLYSGIKKKPAWAILDDRVIRPVGCYIVFFSIHCRTVIALVLLPDNLWMVFGQVVVNVTVPENFSRFNQLRNDSFLQIFICKENQTKYPFCFLFSPHHFSKPVKLLWPKCCRWCLPPRKSFV